MNFAEDDRMTVNLCTEISALFRATGLIIQEFVFRANILHRMQVRVKQHNDWIQGFHEAEPNPVS